MATKKKATKRRPPSKPQPQTILRLSAALDELLAARRADLQATLSETHPNFRAKVAATFAPIQAALDDERFLESASRLVNAIEVALLSTDPEAAAAVTEMHHWFEGKKRLRWVQLISKISRLGFRDSTVDYLNQHVETFGGKPIPYEAVKVALKKKRTPEGLAAALACASGAFAYGPHDEAKARAAFNKALGANEVRRSR